MKRQIYTSLILTLFVLLNLWYFFIIIKHPFLGVHLDKQDGQWIVRSVDMESNVGSQIAADDIVLKIDGMEPGQFKPVIQWRTIEQAHRILVSRSDEIFQVVVERSPFFVSYDFTGFVGEGLCLIIAAILYRKMNRVQSARFLCLVFLTIGLTFMNVGASARGDSIGKTFISTFIMLLPVILLHFFSVFFEEKSGVLRKKNTLKIMYGFIVIAFIFQLFLFMNEKSAYFVYKIMEQTNVSFFIIGVVLNIVFLIQIYFKYRNVNKDITIILKTIFVSTVLSFVPLICFTFIPNIIYGDMIIDSYYSSWAVLFFPLSFTYLLATKKLYDIDLVVRRFILTTMMSLIPSGIAVGMIAVLFPAEAEADRLIVTFLLLVVLLSFTLYSLEYFTTKLERVMFPRKYRLQMSMKKIARNLGLISSFRELKEIILVDIIETLQVFGGAIVFRYKETKETIHEGAIDPEEAERLADAQWPDHPSYTRQEIIRNEEYTCYLILSQKKANTHLGFEETQWLGLITTYLSISLENLHLIRKLTLKLEGLAAHLPNEEASADFAWFRKLMFELQEKERVRIATDLHDTTMQDLFFLKRRCTSLMEKYPLNPDGLAQMNGIIEYIDIINMNLRQSCFELHPYLLQEIGLIRTIEKLIELERTISPFRIEFRVSQPSWIESVCDAETKRHLFRVVQELLNNAKKHSQASTVKLILQAVNARVTLSYEDDGVGFDVDETAAMEIGRTRTGVEYMKSRILSLDGQYELTAGKGNGMKFVAAFPLKEGRTA